MNKAFTLACIVAVTIAKKEDGMARLADALANAKQGNAAKTHDKTPGLA